MHRTANLILAALVSAACAAAQAQSFPSRAVKVVVTTPPGVTPDVTARIIANKLAESWRGPVLVDNRPGAGGTIAADVVAKATPDGYTVLYAPNPVPTMAPFLYTKLPYAQSDLRPITIVAQLGFVLLANKDLPVDSLQELAAYARAHPGKVSFASYGVGSGTHLIVERLESDLNIKLLHVPYKSNPVPDLIGGQVQLLLEPYGGSGVEAYKAGRVKALGVTLNSRSPALPKVPAISEVVKGFESPGWLGFWLPARTPEEVVQKYQAGISKAMEDPAVQRRFKDLSIDPVDTGPAAMATAIGKESRYWGTLIKRLGISLD